MACCVAATLLLALVAVFGPAGAACAQALPPADATLEAFRTVEAWVREGGVPAEPARIDPPGTRGACVTLRLAEAVVGRASVMADDGASVWRAAQRAFAEARPRLVVGGDGRVWDAAAIEEARLAAQRLVIDVQVAGELVPLPDRPLEEMLADISPGFHGVAARVGDRVEAVFPGAMLSTNTLPGAAIAACVNALDLPAVNVGDPRVSLANLRRERGLVLYRFAVQHLAQPEPGAPPIFLHRGGRVVRTTDLSPDALAAYEDGLVAHLEAALWPGDEARGLLGTRRPWTGDYEEPVLADPRAQLLAAIALQRSALASSHDPARARARALLAWRILADLGVVEEGETAPGGHNASLALLRIAAALESEIERTLAGALPELSGDLRRRALDAVELTPEQEVRFGAMFTDGAFEPSLAPAERAVVAYAYALAATVPARADRAVNRDRAERAVRTLFRETSPGDLPNLMPWLGWAELRLTPEGQPVPAAVALRALRTTVQRFTLAPADLGEQDRDLIGGVVFTRARSPLPSWQGTRVLSFLATMLGDERLTSDDELAAEFARLLPQLRFAAQLIVGEAEMHMLRDRRRTLGGARMALWDQRQPVEASAMALLTFTEARAALAARSR